MHIFTTMKAKRTTITIRPDVAEVIKNYSHARSGKRNLSKGIKLLSECTCMPQFIGCQDPEQSNCRKL